MYRYYQFYYCMSESVKTICRMFRGNRVRNADVPGGKSQSEIYHHRSKRKYVSQQKFATEYKEEKRGHRVNPLSKTLVAANSNKSRGIHCVSVK